MALAVNVIDRCGPSNKMCHQLQPKKTKVMLYYIAGKKVLTRQSALVLKVGMAYGWKITKED